MSRNFTDASRVLKVTHLLDADLSPYNGFANTQRLGLDGVIIN